MKKLLLFIAVLSTLIASGQKISNKNYINGCKLFLEADFAGASKEYAKALDSEKKKRTLDKPNFYVLIDNLGMSYGISGKMDEAIKTLEYGVSMDTNYPMFYYNLACCYGEQNNLDKVIHYLELAIKNRGNMLEGEKFPDPKSDDSFKSFVNNDRFKKTLSPLEN